jgi:RNA polymerase sigma-70 factor (ECF subfamily)
MYSLGVQREWLGEAEASTAGRERTVRIAEESHEVRLRRILATHLDFIGRTLRAFGALETDVDDGVQQVCLVLADKLDRIEPSAERAFVFQTAHRIASRVRRTRARRLEEPYEDSIAPETAVDPEQLVDARQAFDVLNRLLDTLDDELRQVFVLYELEDFTMAAIAETLAIPPGTVASRLRRAREQFEVRARRLRSKPTGAP